MWHSDVTYSYRLLISTNEKKANANQNEVYVNNKEFKFK